MTTTRANAEYLESLVEGPRFTISQAENEGRALRGEFGVRRQIAAMSAQYLALRAAGKLDEAAAVKAEATAIRNAAAQQEA